MLDTNRLRVFRSVMASGTIQAAADNLGYTASAVSQHISALQRETGVRLFERRGRGLAPTPAAHELLTQSEDLMGELGRLEKVVGNLREGRSRSLTIGYFASAGVVWMPRLAQRLTAELPDVALELISIESGRPTATPDLSLMIELPEADVPPGFARTPLIDDPYVVAFHVDNAALAGRSEVALIDLVEQIWIQNDLTVNPCHWIGVSACEAAGFTPRYAIQAEDHHTALAFVAAGLGISLMPGLTTARLPDGVRTIPAVSPTPVRRLSVLTRASAAPNRAAERATELLCEIAAEPVAAEPV